MGALLVPGLVSSVIGRLPARLLRLLDLWSHRRAQQRAAQRRQQWRKARSAPAALPSAKIGYQLKPWRD
ncbi:MAG: hypothetical protein JWP41_1770 [Ramlibacter sp.]|jgi:hypothetical protein|nr:hypothetical protein [Ramlibacter sp.]